MWSVGEGGSDGGDVRVCVCACVRVRVRVCAVGACLCFHTSRMTLLLAPFGQLRSHSSECTQVLLKEVSLRHLTSHQVPLASRQLRA